ncbi:MAG: N-(5'-phosphoribosyl)anthranilate isomerase [Paracoccaceae bacterium]|nr:N-(5'-phosphoribosyl)anthranilate isomerase [Paracoccaceae bacterium]
MRPLPPAITPEIWLRQVFGSHAALDGGVVRRKVRDVERIVGREAFEAHLRRRGFRAIENAGQYVVFCNRDPVRLID